MTLHPHSRSCATHDSRVHYISVKLWAEPMKNITLSADERLIEAARERARREHTTLNAEFRRWLVQYARRRERAEDYRKVMDELRGNVRVGKKLSRDEMNER